MIKKKVKGVKASEVFKVGTHGIGYVWSSFLEEFGNDMVLPGSALSFQKLPRSMKDSEIISELGVKDCTLGDVIATIDAATPDMKDGYLNIFYIKGHSRVVLVFWHAGEWYVGGWDRGDASWGEGRRVFSPATGALSSSPKSSDPLTLEILAARIEKIEKKLKIKK